MMTNDQAHAMIRAALTGDGTITSLVPGGFRQERQSQSGSSPYGIVRVDQTGKQQTSGGIFWTYSVTVAVYGNASATFQSAIAAAMSSLLDFRPTALTPPAGAGLVMIAPTKTDQRVEQQMRSGVDVVPVIASWSMKTCESRP